ncbi:MAG: type II toxin-antitoxin system RelE/ParE family toxin [Pseudomonadota bacterium]
MAQVIWTEPALEDINEIAEYIALDNPIAARDLVRRLIESVKRLKEFPESGRVPPEFDDFRYRELVVGPCRIFYRVDDTTIFVLYVMRGERAFRNFILEDRGRSGS